MLIANLLLVLSPAPLLFQEGTYRLPPPEVVELVDAPTTPSVSVSDDGRWLLEVVREPLPSIADLARPMLRLAGMRIDPTSGGRHRSSFSGSFSIRPLAEADRGGGWTGPAGGARYERVSFSPSSQHVVAVGNLGDRIELTAWKLGGTARPKPVTLSEHLVTVLVNGPGWMPDGKRLLLFEAPEGRGAAPSAPTVPGGPNVRETSGAKSALRTYQDLLATPYDEALFEYHGTTQLVIADVDSGARRPIGEPALYLSVSPSPDGKHLLVTRLARPFSYSMPYYSFPHTIEVWDLQGRCEHVVAEVPLGENIPLHGVRIGPRSVSWRADEAATVVWVEALDGGDPKREVASRDRWLELSAPFDGEPTELLKLEHRARSLGFMETPGLILASEYDRDRRWNRTWLVDLATGAEPRLLEDRSARDRYGDPGTPVSFRNARGRRVVLQDGPWIWRTGRGDGPGGARPFVDRQNLETLETERLWRCAEGEYESVERVLTGDDGRPVSFITRHESPVAPPNYRQHWLAETGLSAPLTAYPDPQPALRGVAKELLTYERNDGVPLSATLYLPAGYEPGTKLPLFVWAYPLEYNDVSTAGQISGSPHRFVRIGGSSHLFLLTQGYAVLDGATMPIVGDPETMNDTFNEQIVAAAQAAIDVAVARGVADPERVVVGGHSYGAFMTANLLAHCDLFAAGIARSGAYNRTLTPFGFQSERRTLWESPETYFAISPFMHAEKIDEPLLLIHGEMDNNSGTFPIQSERLFQAIKGHGGTARLVFLPYESHGYRSRESILHTLAEMIDWGRLHAGPRASEK